MDSNSTNSTRENRGQFNAELKSAAESAAADPELLELIGFWQSATREEKEAIRDAMNWLRS